LHVSRYQTGFGQERGGLAVDIYNNMDHAVEIVYLETIPWILKLYLHTLKVVQNGLDITNDKSIYMIFNSVEMVKEIYYQGSINRKNPNVLEMSIVLPSKSHTLMKIDFDKTHLRITEHPPDANRGFDIGYN
jgi:phosphatidylinositol glycan class T